MESSKAKLKAKRLARNDGNPMPSPMPEARKDGNPMPSPMPMEKTRWQEIAAKTKTKCRKGKGKASKPLLRRTFRVTQRPTPSGQDYVVAITVDGRPATEEDRRGQMAALAFAMAVQQSSSPLSSFEIAGWRTAPSSCGVIVSHHRSPS